MKMSRIAARSRPSPTWARLAAGGRVVANDPSVLILTSLASCPKHGHALAADIRDFAGVDLGPGTLYGAITRLEERGLIEALPTDDRRRPYQLTVAGRSALAEALEDMGRIVHVGKKRLRLSPRMAR